jgi:hypothetical protein
MDRSALFQSALQEVGVNDELTPWRSGEDREED